MEAKMNRDDPMERRIARALDTAGIAYTRQSVTNLDFELHDGSGVFIEVKRMHSPRIAEQMSRVKNVIAVQGDVAVEWLAKQIERGHDV
jgi:hypothetical protein